MLYIKGLRAGIDSKEILKGVALKINRGEIHAIMGPNGSGKSTLAMSIMGHPSYSITKGTVTIDRKNLLDLDVDERSKAGLFLAFQYPMAIPGVSVLDFLRTAYLAHNMESISIIRFKGLVEEQMDKLNIDKNFLDRYLNDGFSGGEKKKLEILQMAIIKPKYAILDETDSGLDIDALRIVAEGVEHVQKETNMGVIVITHYQRLLDYIRPDYVHILSKGKIIRSGDYRLAKELEKKGYEGLDSDSI